MSLVSTSPPTLDHPQLHGRARSHRRRLTAGGAAVAVLALGLVATVPAIRYAHDDSRRHYLGADGWPTRGEAAYQLGDGPRRASTDQQPVPIASLAKVMTAYLVLRSAPLHDGDDGFRFTVSARDVADTAARADRDESVIRVATNETLTERQGLVALLLPSANNVAIMLARRVAGTVGVFVGRMNAAARALGMDGTTYTDPSGFDARTRSTAADQLVLAQRVMRNRTFANLVALPSYVLPVAGTVHNTDRLLGSEGFIGIKTGSDDAAGGCFMFRTRHVIDGLAVNLTGVVLGQQGHSLLSAALYATRQFVRRITPAG